MHSEKLKRAPLSPLLGVCLILALVIIVIGISTLSATMFARFNIPYFDYFIVGVLGIAGFFIIKWFVQEYGYSLDGDTLMFYKIFGGKERLVYKLSLKDILSYGPAVPGEIPTGERKIFAFRSGQYTRIAIKNGDGAAHIYFCPSAELDGMIKETIEAIEDTIKGRNLIGPFDNMNDLMTSLLEDDDDVF